MSEEDVAKQLYDAVTKRNVTSVERSNGGALLSAKFGDNDETALHAACRAGDLEVVQALLLLAKAKSGSKGQVWTHTSAFGQLLW